jgi:2,5-diketo-D-gluconate reductase B
VSSVSQEKVRGAGCVEVPGGGRMPLVGLGTYKLEGRACYDVVQCALSLGYRHFDTAEAYRNEADIGQALTDSGINRQDLFITTKIWPTHFRPNLLKLALTQSLKRLRMPYVDLLLLHWPNPDTPLAGTLAALAEVQAAGLARAIGVSNFPISLLREIKDVHRVEIACNQIEYHALLTQQPMIEFAGSSGLMIAAHSPLAQGRLVRDSTLAEIGRKYDKTASQVALRWIVQQGIPAMPKASNEVRLRQNLDLFDFCLDAAEIGRIAALNTGFRVVESRDGRWD